MIKQGQIVDRREMLKIKIKYLTYESRLNRATQTQLYNHEKRLREKGLPVNEQLRNEIHWHRVTVLREEIRHTQLAYGFIRGRTYEQMEPNGSNKTIDWTRVWRMVKDYGPAGLAERLEKPKEGLTCKIGTKEPNGTMKVSTELVFPKEPVAKPKPQRPSLFKRLLGAA